MAFHLPPLLPDLAQKYTMAKERLDEASDTDNRARVFLQETFHNLLDDIIYWRRDGARPLTARTTGSQAGKEWRAALAATDEAQLAHDVANDFHLRRESREYQYELMKNMLGEEGPGHVVSACWS
jgi:hypothetical protein